MIDEAMRQNRNSFMNDSFESDFSNDPEEFQRRLRSSSRERAGELRERLIVNQI
jgi:hypothetical protein